ncbi:MAG TPA: hypothetical protein VKX49_31630 [Bryobacteraceae bacterium]|nr:hypothetical protein [Bryobacteraceae bacterium]
MSKRFLPAVCCLLGSGVWLLSPAQASDKKLTDDDRVEILRGLLSEYATVKTYLPRSPKPLPFESTGTWDKQAWTQAGQKYGAAARVGDAVQITKVTIQDDKILFEINHGMKGRRGGWRDHVQIGMAGPIGGGVSQVDPNQSTSAPSGTNIALLFDKAIPPLKADDIKKILAPVLSFEKETATENLVETLPEPVKQAIKANKAIEGMDRDEVILALGKPRHKERNVTPDGTETEDWIYGEPPGKITFVTFSNSKVIRIKEAYADIGGSTASPTPVR